MFAKPGCQVRGHLFFKELVNPTDYRCKAIILEGVLFLHTFDFVFNNPTEQPCRQPLKTIKEKYGKFAIADTYFLLLLRFYFQWYVNKDTLFYAGQPETQETASTVQSQ